MKKPNDKLNVICPGCEKPLSRTDIEKECTKCGHEIKVGIYRTKNFVYIPRLRKLYE